MKFHFLAILTLCLLLLVYWQCNLQQSSELSEQIDQPMIQTIRWAPGSYAEMTYKVEEHIIVNTPTYGTFGKDMWTECNEAGRQKFPHWGCYGSSESDQKIYLYNADQRTIQQGKGSIVEYKCYGCKDELAFNYDPICYMADSVCQYGIAGCTNPNAINYNPLAKIDDGSCEFKSVRLQYLGMWPDKCQISGELYYSLEVNDIALKCQKQEACCGFTYDNIQSIGVLKTNCTSPCPKQNFSYNNIISYYTSLILKPANCVLTAENLVPYYCQSIGAKFQITDLKDISTNCLVSGNCCGFVYQPQTSEGWYSVGCQPSANCTEKWMPQTGANYYSCYDH